MQSLLRRTTAYLTPSHSSSDLSKTSRASPSPEPYIFPRVDPATDGPDCLADCDSCTIHYPARWSINESHALYGQIRGYATHIVVATGKSDWVRDVADEKGSVMEAVGKWSKERRKREPEVKKEGDGVVAENGLCMVSAANMVVPQEEEEKKGETEVLVLPRWEIVSRVGPSRAGEFMEEFVGRVATTMSNLVPRSVPPPPTITTTETNRGSDADPATATATAQATKQLQTLDLGAPSPPVSIPKPRLLQPITTTFPTRPCPHRALILLCSQKTRDARCGQSAPLLRREFERHLRPLGLYRDLHDERPGGVGIYFISHVGGHKYSANVMVYRRAGWDVGPPGAAGKAEEKREGEEDSGGDDDAKEDGLDGEGGGEAVQCIWLARVRPEHCEGIVKYTVLQGKVVKPETQLRGGFDRRRGLVSW